MPRCIVHIPYTLDNVGMAAPMLRPRKMIEGFSEIGYKVDVVAGNATERKKIIKEIKKKISRGIKYDFMYAESSTIPTLLTEKNHLPLHPFLDFSFFKYIKNNGIKIGLFYRDIYWKFDSYKEGLPAWKSFCAIQCYKYELKKYENLLNKFYLPSLKVYTYLQTAKLGQIVDVLPPGSSDVQNKQVDEEIRNFSERPLNIFYVGGIGNQYQIAELMAAMENLENCELTICCRKTEWEREKATLEKYIFPNIHIIHKKNSELEEEYNRADVCSLMFKSDIYMEMAMPYKAFEYLAYNKPVLSTKGTAISEFVEKNQTGWSICYASKEIKDKLSEIINNPRILDEKRLNCMKAKEFNTWKARAGKVSHDLKS